MKADLNLFVVFDTIYHEGSITKAASVLNLSQPAVSHALNKLRCQFDDPLFVRQGNQMRPTTVAKNVITDVREALHQLQACLQQSKQFEPATSRKKFTIAMHGTLEASYLPPLIKSVNEQAPNVLLQSHRRIRRSELENKLASSEIDLAIDVLIPVSQNILHKQIAQDDLVVIARKNHPLIGDNLDLETYLNQKHILVSSRSSGPGLEDFELGRLGLERQIGLRCQHTLAACQIVLQSDMLLTLSKTAAQMYSTMLDIATYRLPVKLPTVDMHLYWHINTDKDPSNKWLREKAFKLSNTRNERL